jgi:glycosyltransferase involved in cell wall biosynthesis
MKIAFHSNQLGLRGTEVSLYDYARYNEEILGNTSIIISDKNATLDSYDKFNARFPVFLYNNFSEVESIIDSNSIDCLYLQKAGDFDSRIVSNARNLIHAVFMEKEVHGDVYAYISKWLSDKMSNGTIPYVPYMIDLPTHDLNYKTHFNLDNKFVVGWYGGNNFDIPFAQQAVINVAQARKDIEFLFMNHDPFTDLENVKFIQGTHNMDEKVAFINTCDAMIHGRFRGETFGLTVAESSTLNKPVITYNGSAERNHIDILGDAGMYYSDYDSLVNILMNISTADIKDKDWNRYTDYTPAKVMQQFNKVFLQ